MAAAVDDATGSSSDEGELTDPTFRAVRDRWKGGYFGPPRHPFLWNRESFWVESAERAWSRREHLNYILFKAENARTYGAYTYRGSGVINVAQMLDKPGAKVDLVRKRIRIFPSQWRQGIPGMVLREVALSHTLRSSFLMEVQGVGRAFPMTRAEAKEEDRLLRKGKPPPRGIVKPEGVAATLPPFTVDVDYDTGAPRLSGALTLYYERPAFDLNSILYWHQEKLPPMDMSTWPVLLGFIAEASHQLACLHRVGVVHRDVRPQTLFVFERRRPDEKPSIKLGNLGIGLYADVREKSVYEPRKVYDRDVLTMAYAPPEYWTRKNQTSGFVDVWSLALILLETMARSVPFRPEFLDSGMVGDMKQDVENNMRTFWKDIDVAGTGVRRRGAVIREWILGQADAILREGYEEAFSGSDSEHKVEAYHLRLAFDAMDLFAQRRIGRRYRVRTRFRSSFRRAVELVGRGLSPLASGQRPTMHEFSKELLQLWDDTVRGWEDVGALVARGRTLVSPEDVPRWKSMIERVRMDACPLQEAPSMQHEAPTESWGLTEAKMEPRAWDYRRVWVDAAAEVVSVVKQWFSKGEPRRAGKVVPLSTYVRRFGAQWKPLLVVATDWLIRYYPRALWSPLTTGVVVFVALKLMYQLPRVVSIMDAAWLAEKTDEWTFRMEEQAFLYRTQMKLVFLPEISAGGNVWAYVQLMYELGGGRLP